MRLLHDLSLMTQRASSSSKGVHINVPEDLCLKREFKQTSAIEHEQHPLVHKGRMCVR